MRRLRLPVLFSSVVCGGVLLARCEAPPDSRRNVVLVTLDTTRADRLGQYGRPDVRTPVFDAWARGGGVVEWTVADVPLTLPSHATLMTGTPSLAHGVRTNADFRLGSAAETLAERLSDLGYRTEAVVSSVVLGAASGIAQGFDHFDDDLMSPYRMQDPSAFPETTHWLPDVDRRADEAIDRALELLEGSVPFFLWIHLYDPHFPYDPPPPWSFVAGDPYRGEIEFVDFQLGRLRRRLRALGLERSTALVVTADHGEGLGDHREDEHGIFLYDEALRVPLMIRADGAIPPSTVRGEQVRTLDVAPTVLALAGAPPGLGAGGSLLPALRGEGPAPDSLACGESIKSRLAYSGSNLKCVRTRSAKLIVAPRPELYDLRADPGEVRNLFTVSDRRAAGLRAELERFVKAALALSPGPPESAALDPRTLENLRSLGYVAHGARPPEATTFAAEMDFSGFDPKDLVDVAMAGRDVRNGFPERAERKLHRFFETVDPPEVRPELSPLWSLARQNLAAVELARGNPGRAAAHYREALRHEESNADARWGLVFALNRAGRPGEGEREAARMLRETPDAWRLRLHRGLALALLGRRTEASTVFADIAEGCPDEDVKRVAILYRGKLGTDEERAYLDLYLSSGE